MQTGMRSMAARVMKSAPTWPMVSTPWLAPQLAITEYTSLNGPLPVRRGANRGGPGGVGAGVELVVHRFGQRYAPAFGNLQHRPQTFDDVHPGHGERHAAFGQEAGREAAAAEVFVDRRAPFGRREAGIRLALLNLPVGFHRRIALRVALLAGAVQRRRAGVNQVNDAVLRPPGERLPGDPFNGIRRPVGAYVGKHRAVPVS